MIRAIDLAILNNLPISAYSAITGLLNFDTKIFVNVARLEICLLFTQDARRGHPGTLDTFLVFVSTMAAIVLFVLVHNKKQRFIFIK